MVMGYSNAKVGIDNVGREHVMAREGVQAEEIWEESKTAWKKTCDVGLGKKNFPTQLKGSPLELWQRLHTKWKRKKL